MAGQQLVDIDEVLEKWAKIKFGTDFVVEKIDTSRVEVDQKAVTYQSGGDWWGSANMSEEFFDNHEPRPITTVFTETVPFNSNASWTLSKAFKSNRYLPLKIDLSYPVAQAGKVPLQVQFSLVALGNTSKSDSVQSTWRVRDEVQIGPYSSACVVAQVRTCKLQNVVFATELYMSGTIKVSGSKKGKWAKQETSASIVEALSGKEFEALGFTVVENKSQSQGPARQVVFKFEGVCSGEVGIEARVLSNEISTLV